MRLAEGQEAGVGARVYREQVVGSSSLHGYHLQCWVFVLLSKDLLFQIPSSGHVPQIFLLASHSLSGLF
jgi:hypothetical protein